MHEMRQQDGNIKQLRGGLTMFCVKCGEKIEAGERFCGGCGAPVLEQPTQRQQEQTFVRETASSAPVKNNNNKLVGLITCAIVAIIVIIGVSSLFSGGYSSAEDCYICDRSPAKKFVTVNGTTRHYCKDHVTSCTFCSNKATKNYTNFFDYHVFVCKEHYESMAS